MKKSEWIWTVLLAVIMIAAVCVSRAGAQIPNPNDVSRYGLATGDFWGPSRNIRCRNAMLNGWHNPGEMPSSCVALMTTVPQYAQYNNQPGGFFNRGGRNMNYGLGGGYYNNNGRWWASVAAQGIQTVGDVIVSSQNNGTIREVERGRNRLEQQRIDGDQEIARRREDRAGRILGMKERQQDYELKQLEGRYTAKQVGSISQPSETNRTLYNNSSCEISVYRNGRLKFTLPSQESILIPNLTYEWESDGCDVQVGEITISSPRR